MRERVSSEALELLKGAIDTHVHSEPSFFKRSVDDFSLAEKVVEYGMKGVVIKCHEGSSVFRAELTKKHVANRALIFGSLVLNYYSGGLNPYAVDSEIKLGARIIWMPTVSAENHRRFYGNSQYKAQKTHRSPKEPAEGIKIIDENGDILDSVKEILDIIAQEDVCLATGHLSNEEGIILCEEALKRGVKKIVFTHADFETNKLPLEKQLELSRKGVFIEKTMLCLTPEWYSISPEEMAVSIKTIGADRCILSSDFGQTTNPHPVEGFALFIEKMLEQNITPEEIKQMICKNPMTILGLE